MNISNNFIKQYVELIITDSRDSAEFIQLEKQFILEAKKYVDSRNWNYAYTAFKKLGISEVTLLEAGIVDDGYAKLESDLDNKLDLLDDR